MKERPCERFDKRYPASLDILLTGLTDPTQVCEGRVFDISRYGLCVKLPMRFTPGGLVKLAFADSTLFGYVVYSNPEESGFRSGIEVERVLLGERAWPGCSEPSLRKRCLKCRDSNRWFLSLFGA